MLSRRASILTLALLAGSALSTAPAFADTIGTAAAVNPASTALPPAGAQHILKIGNNVVRDERIRTSAAGSVQLLFVDRTTMSIGPDSDVVLDSYVYNPATSTGRMAVTFGKGLMRFVGGEVTHNGEADIQTTAGLIGIRGGIVLLEAGRHATGNAADLLKITVAYGHAFLRGADGRVTTIAPGQTALVGPGGRVVVRATTTADVQRHISAMEQGAGHGAVHVSPALVASALANGAPSQLAIPTAPAPAVADQPPPAPVTSTDVQTTSVTTGTQQSMPSGPGGGGGTVAAGAVFALSMTACCGSGHPASFVSYLPADFFGHSTTSMTMSPVLGFNPKAADALPGFGIPVVQAGVQITDDGGNQKSTFAVMAGSFNAGKLTGDFFASRHSTATSPVTVADGSFAATGSGSGAGVPKSGTVTSTAATFDADKGGLLAGAPQTYSFTQDFAHIATPAGLGKVRADVVLQGFSGGIIDTINHSAGTVAHTAVQSGAFPGAFTVVTDSGSGFVFAYSEVQKVAATSGASFDGFYAYGFDATGGSTNFFRGAYVDSDHFAALDARGSGGAPLSQVNSSAVASSNGGIVSAGMADLSHLNNYTPCKCEYTKWGFWAVDDVRTGGNVEDRGHLMEWVAGQIPDLLGKDIPTTGKATYGGHVVASIQNGGEAYVAAGQFKSTVDFGASTGRVQVNGLDGTNYKGNIALNTANREQFGTVSAMVGRDAATNAATKLRMTLDGAFYGSSANPAREMGGEVAIRGLSTSGANYLGSGIFAASR